MPNEDLLRYIKDSLSQNYTRDHIWKALLQAGWGNEQIEETFRSIQSSSDSTQAQPAGLSSVSSNYVPELTRTQNASPRSMLPLVIIAGVALFAVGIGIMFWTLTKKDTNPSQVVTEQQTASTKATTTDQHRQSVQQEVLSATSSPVARVLSQADLKAKEDLKKTIFELNESIKLKCTAGSTHTQCDLAKRIFQALNEECLPLTDDKEISSCIFGFAGGAIFLPSSAPSTPTKTNVTVSLISTTSFDTAGVTNLNIKAGDKFYSAWSSTDADEAYLTGSLTKCTDVTLNKEVPEKKVPTESYQSEPASTMLVGCTIVVTITVKNTTSGQQATATNTITIK